MTPKIADFPDWFGPMLVKELRQGLKARGFVLSFIGLQTILVLVLVYNVLVYARDPREFDPNGLSAVFWVLIGALLLFVTPLRAFNELAAERKANTLELIFMSGLSAWRITFGKWVSLLFQALLFLLAVLPYAILRYYFGGVNLAEDLQAMLLILLCCAVLSAVALAISGTPLWARVLIAIVAVFFFMVLFMGIIPFLLYGRMMGRGGPSFSSADVSWWIIGWDVLLICLIALQVGAATVAPPAENHAGRQRFLALLLWLPLPIIAAQGLGDNARFSQLGLFTGVANLLIWYQLSVKPSIFQSHCRPFRGWRAIIGVPFQPGWPGAVVFLLIEVMLYLPMMHDVGPSAKDNALFRAAAVLGSGSLLCATFVWVAFRARARFPLLLETLFTIPCGVTVALIMAGKPAGTHLGEEYWFGIIPAMGFWTMMDQSYSYTVHVGGATRSRVPELEVAMIWLRVAYIGLGVYAALLLAWSHKYWLHYFRTCFALARPAPATPKSRA